MSDIAAFGRLIAMGWVLARADALAPRELDPQLPPMARFAARTLRLVAGGPTRKGRAGERLARALERLGPVAIKLGQVLSTRADIFGRAFTDDLAHLKDQLPPFSNTVARVIVSETLGLPLESLFFSFEDPIAAASLAQAHPATLADGRRVAVKLLRPGIEARVGRDIAVMTLAARMIEAAVPQARRLEPKALVATVARSLRLELDLRLEAAGASEMGEVMARDSFMRAPSVVWDGVGRRMLTLTWAPGVALSDSKALEQPGLDRTALADNLVRAFLSQAMDHGVFHADLHEGNLFIAAPDVITAVDFGILGRLSPAARRHLAEILWGFLQRDYSRVARAHFDAGYVPAGQSVEDFAQALRAVGEPNVDRAAADVSMGRLLGQLFEITALFEMRLRPELVLLQKTMLTVEGVARRIDPTHNLWRSAEPVVRRWISRELSPAARVRDLIEDGARVLKALSRLAETPPQSNPSSERQPHTSKAQWFLMGLLTGVAILAGAALATVVLTSGAH
jgi:ubiquinone biosynthesis protein